MLTHRERQRESLFAYQKSIEECTVKTYGIPKATKQPNKSKNTKSNQTTKQIQK
jgi:hypothetical protein